MDKGQTCGGGYIKILDDIIDKEFSSETPFLLQFGPNICEGNAELLIILKKNGSI